MYPYIQKQNRNLQATFAKDKDLMHPIHNAKEENEQREAYINDLMGKTDFVKTYKKNYEAVREPLKHTIKSFSLRHILLILFFGSVFGGVTAGVVNSEKAANTIQTKKDIAKDVAIVFLSVLAGLGIGTSAAVAFKQSDKETAIDNFYNRLIIRYFYKLKRISPDVFSEDILKNCNPEMLRVIAAILMTNMSPEETKKIQNIATTTLFLHDDRDIMTMRKIETNIKTALKIVENCMLKNPELEDLVHRAYTGYIPETFMLNSVKQNTK